MLTLKKISMWFVMLCCVKLYAIKRALGCRQKNYCIQGLRRTSEVEGCVKIEFSPMSFTVISYKFITYCKGINGLVNMME